MKGIYLNEIPMDLFFKYFNQTNLQNNRLEPVMERYLANTYTYTITITDGHTSHSRDITYKSIFKSFDETTPQLLGDIADLIVKPLESITVIGPSEPSTETELVYIRTGNEIFVYPYPTYFRYENGDTNYFASLNTEKNSLIDARTGASFEAELTTVTDAGRIKVYKAGALLGYLYYNKILEVKSYDEITKKQLFLDEYGQQTTRTTSVSNFLRHNSLLRANFSNLIDKNEVIVDKFTPGVIGILDTGLAKKAIYYENFTRTINYSKPGSIDGDDIRYTEINKEVYSNAPYQEVADDFAIKEVLNFSELTTYKRKFVEELSTTIKASNVGYVNYPEIGEHIILQTYRDFVQYKDTKYLVASDNTVPIPRFGGSVTLSGNFIKVPAVSTADGEYYISIDGVNKYFIKNSLKNYTVIVDNNIYILKVENKGDYFILIPCKVIKVDYNKYIGTVDSIDSTAQVFELGLITIDGESLSILDNFDLDDFVFADPIYTKTYYEVDLLDESILKVEEILSKDALSADYRKYIETNKSGASIVKPLVEKDFFANFDVTSPASHYISSNYVEKRGEIVPEGIFETQKKNMLKQLSAEFINKNLDDFLIINSGSYDTNAILKMRIYAEGFNQLVFNDRQSLPIYLKRKELLFYSDLNKKVILKKDILPQKMAYDFQIDEIAGLMQLARLNTFQKINDYKNFATNEERLNYYRKYSQRQQAYTAFTSTTNQFNDLVDFTEFRVLKKNTTALTEFKDNIASQLVNSFFESNAYNDKYSVNYEYFYEPKMKNLVSKYNDILFETTYKFIFTEDDIGTTKEDDFIKNILTISNDTNWRVK